MARSSHFDRVARVFPAGMTPLRPARPMAPRADLEPLPELERRASARPAEAESSPAPGVRAPLPLTLPATTHDPEAVAPPTEEAASPRAHAERVPAPEAREHSSLRAPRFASVEPPPAHEPPRKPAANPLPPPASSSPHLEALEASVAPVVAAVHAHPHEGSGVHIGSIEIRLEPPAPLPTELPAVAAPATRNAPAASSERLARGYAPRFGIGRG